MQSNLNQCLSFTELREGLYQCRRNDAGNWTGGRIGVGKLIGTMRGISAPVLVEWLGSKAIVDADVMKALSQQAARDIAISRYWRPLWCDRLLSGVDLMMFDYGFNAGVYGALACLADVVGYDHNPGQMTAPLLDLSDRISDADLVKRIDDDWTRALQRQLRVSDDGVIGPVTLRAVHASGVRGLLTIFALATRQEQAYRQMSDFRTSGRGWLVRLNDRVNMAVVMGRKAIGAAA
ncbi:glycosyl hydrolase 108 family protein [Acetobacter sp. DsW_063]|uniref:glycosyl hydrolase 108 family protein n=1 Tax=Acetobacter sp. DsW_063 TaxID=1514894 RepID=UPI000A3A7A85|nr:glycosyl hydrolase 108 family protein [Acetobacter sp. DsW_063]OUJ17073.1 hypothetical protein HK28_07850 [Acetobacter sp. DsW_063]